MVDYKIRITNQTTFLSATFDGNNYCKYTDRLNNIDEATIKLPASTPKTRELFEIGINNIVEILKDGVVEFKGHGVGKSYLDGGAISLRCVSRLALLGKDGYDVDETWIKKPTSVIATDIIADAGLSVGTIDNAFTLDFKAKVSSSYLNILKNLRFKTNQDLYYDDSNNTINLVDHKGSSTSVMTLNDGLDFVNPIFDQLEPKGNKIIVYGSGLGKQRIVSEYPAHGQNSSSQTTWGVILHTETDPTIVSTLEANKLADALEIVYGDSVKSYKFDLVNPSLNLESGDVITLNSLEKDIVAEEVRISEIEKGSINGREFLTLTVANKEYSQVLKIRNNVLGGTNRHVRDTDTYTDGSENTLNYVNAQNSSRGDLKTVIVNLDPADVLDFAGNPRINSVTVDYKVEGALKSGTYGVVNDVTINGDGLALDAYEGKTTFFGASSYTTGLPLTSLSSDMTLFRYNGDDYLIIVQGSTGTVLYKYDKVISKSWTVDATSIATLPNATNTTSFEYDGENYYYSTHAGSTIDFKVLVSGSWATPTGNQVTSTGLPSGSQYKPEAFWENNKLYCFIADDDYLTTGNSRLVLWRYNFTAKEWFKINGDDLEVGLPYTYTSATSAVGFIKQNIYRHLGRLYMFHIVDNGGTIASNHYIWNYDSWELATDSSIPYTMHVEGLGNSQYESESACIGYIADNLIYFYYDNTSFPVSRVTRNTWQLLGQENFDGLEGFNLPITGINHAGVYKIEYGSNILSATLLDYATLNVNVKHQKTE